MSWISLSQKKLYGENNFAEGARLHHRLVRARRIAERQLASDHRIERAVGEAGRNPGVDLREVCVVDVEQRHAEHRRIASHRLTRIDLDAAAVADDDDAAEFREQPEI